MPNEIREKLNRSIEDGQEGKALVEWLNGLPEVKAVLEAEFGGNPISESNLTQWKQGGYVEWQRKEEEIETVLRLGGDAADYQQAAKGLMADQLALCATVRLAMRLRSESLSNEEHDERQLEGLLGMCREVARLRRGDQHARMLQLAEQRLELEKRKYDDEVEELKRERKKAEGVKEGGLPPEVMEEFERAIGML